MQLLHDCTFNVIAYNSNPKLSSFLLTTSPFHLFQWGHHIAKWLEVFHHWIALKCFLIYMGHPTQILLGTSLIPCHLRSIQTLNKYQTWSSKWRITKPLRTLPALFNHSIDKIIWQIQIHSLSNVYSFQPSKPYTC